MIEYAKPRPVRCVNGRRHHRWIDHVASVFRAVKAFIDYDPALRVCRHCGAKGRVNKQGIVEVGK